MMISYANAETIRAPLQSTEVERRMQRVALPEVIVLDCQLPNVTGE